MPLTPLGLKHKPNRYWILGGVVIVWMIGAIVQTTVVREHSPQLPESHMTDTPAAKNGPNQTQMNTQSTGAKLSGATPEQRLHVARMLSGVFQQQDLEISAVAAGAENDTLVFTSEMFGTSEGRLEFIQGYRKNWESLHCQLGFRKLVLSKGTFSLGDKEYDLHCPMTAAELAAAADARTKEAAGLQDDLLKQGLTTTAQAQGQKKDRLVISSDLFKTRADRDKFVDQVKPIIQEKMCAQGFTGIRLQTSGQNSHYTEYKLECFSSN